MTERSVLDAYGHLAENHELPAMGPAQALVDALELPDPSVVWPVLAGLSLREGWLELQSEVRAFSGGALPDGMENGPAGQLLAVEAVTGDGRSLAVCPDGRAGLRLTLVTPLQGDAPAPPAGWRRVAHIQGFADRVRHRATARTPARAGGHALIYTRYWRTDPERGPVPVLAAFIGFGPEED